MFLLKCQSQNSLFSLQLSTNCAYTGCCLGYGQTPSGVTVFSTELPTCATDGVVKPTAHAVRTVLITPTTYNGCHLKSSSLKAFLANGQIPEFSNPAKIFFMINETGCAEMIIVVRLRLVIFYFQDWPLSSHFV